MSESGLARSVEQITQALEPMPPLAVLHQLQRRHSTADFDWFVGRTHAEYSRDEVTPSHEAYMTTRRLQGVFDAFVGGSFIVQKSMIVPEDLSEKGIQNFIEATVNNEYVPYAQFGRVLINEPGGFFRGDGREIITTLQTGSVGLELAAKALNESMNNGEFIELVSEDEAAYIVELHEEVRAKLCQRRSDDLRSGIRYLL